MVAFTINMDIFNALADPTRRHIIEQLNQHGEQSIKQLGQGLNITRQALTKHLDKLVKAKLVSAEFVGKHRVHRLNDKSLYQLKRWLSPFEQAWEHRLGALSEHLGEDHDKQD